MRDLDVQILTETTARLLVEANYRIPPDINEEIGAQDPQERPRRSA